MIRAPLSPVLRGEGLGVRGMDAQTPGRGAGGEGLYVDPIEFAKYQRQTARSYDQLLWQLLRNRQRCGKKFRRQHPLGIYTADFYCAEAKLVVEVDGSPHQTAEGKWKDEARDAWMRSQEIEVLRFDGWQVEFEARQVLERIDAALRQRCAK
jgi:very-short-patch-repair endonuclease